LTLLLNGLEERIARALAILLVAIFAADALLALVEFSTGWRLIHIEVPEGVTADPTRTDLVFDWRADLASDWRATALFGHPLENAMLMGAFLLCLVSRGTAWLGSGLRFGLGVLALLAMFAFGGRVSLVFSMLIAGGRRTRRLGETADLGTPVRPQDRDYRASARAYPLHRARDHWRDRAFRSGRGAVQGMKAAPSEHGADRRSRRLRFLGRATVRSGRSRGVPVLFCRRQRRLRKWAIARVAALKRRAELKRAVEIKAGFYRDALPHSHVLSAAKKAQRSAHGKGA
jgi:hypothetical protein